MTPEVGVSPSRSITVSSVVGLPQLSHVGGWCCDSKRDGDMPVYLFLEREHTNVFCSASSYLPTKSRGAPPTLRKTRESGGFANRTGMGDGGSPASVCKPLRTGGRRVCTKWNTQVNRGAMRCWKAR